MNIRWDHFVNQYDTTRDSGPDGRDTRHIQFVREFASVVSEGELHMRTGCHRGHRCSIAAIPYLAHGRYITDKGTEMKLIFPSRYLLNGTDLSGVPWR